MYDALLDALLRPPLPAPGPRPSESEVVFRGTADCCRLTPTRRPRAASATTRRLLDQRPVGGLDGGATPAAPPPSRRAPERRRAVLVLLLPLLAAKLFFFPADSASEALRAPLPHSPAMPRTPPAPARPAAVVSRRWPASRRARRAPQHAVARARSPPARAEPLVHYDFQIDLGTMTAVAGAPPAGVRRMLAIIARDVPTLARRRELIDFLTHGTAASRCRARAWADA